MAQARLYRIIDRSNHSLPLSKFRASWIVNIFVLTNLLIIYVHTIKMNYPFTSVGLNLEPRKCLDFEWKLLLDSLVTTTKEVTCFTITIIYYYCLNFTSSPLSLFRFAMYVHIISDLFGTLSYLLLITHINS